MEPRTIAVVGGALSGPAAAAAARHTDKSARIVILEQGASVRYAVGALAYSLSGEIAGLHALNRRLARRFERDHHIEVRTRVRVERIDAEGHQLFRGRERLRYDRLIFAAGAESVLPDVPGLGSARNVFCFRTPRDLTRISAALERGARRITILGGGYFGVEAADGFLRRKCRVTIVERQPELLARHSITIAAMATEALQAAGATVMTGAAPASVMCERSLVTSLALSDGRRIKTDLVIVAAGLRPRTDLLRDAGARLLPDGTVPIDEHAATSLPDVFACGVCVSVPHAPWGRPIWFAQAAMADKTAQVAGICAAGGDARLGSVLGTAILRAGDTTVARTGVTGSEAGPDAAVLHVSAPSHDECFPGWEPIAIELTYQRSTGRVLGAELAGRTGVDKRIDVLATAVAGGLTVEQLAALDLAYAPPYSAVRDPVNVAGNAATAR